MSRPPSDFANVSPPVVAGEALNHGRTLILLLGCASLGLACDSVTAGEDQDPGGPPVLRHIMIQDETPSGGRFIATDLLDTLPPQMCDALNPCPADGPVCPTMSSTVPASCPKPFSPATTPPAIGTPIALGGNMIRVAWNKRLDPALDVMPPVRVTGPNGTVPALTYYDPSGAPGLTPYLFGLGPIAIPYGPALVIKPNAPLWVNTRYQIELDLTQIRDEDGNQPSRDLNGSTIQGSYSFATEDFYLLGSTPALDMGAMITPNDFLTVNTNADIAAETVTATTVVVTDASGAVVPSRAFLQIADKTMCAATTAHRALVVVPLERTGTTSPGQWPAGTLTLTIDGVRDADTRRSPLKAANGSAASVNGKFVVMGPSSDPMSDPQAVANLVLPEACSGT